MAAETERDGLFCSSDNYCNVGSRGDYRGRSYLGECVLEKEEEKKEGSREGHSGEGLERCCTKGEERGQDSEEAEEKGQEVNDGGRRGTSGFSRRCTGSGRCCGRW